MQDLEAAFDKKSQAAEMKYKTDPKFAAKCDKLHVSVNKLGFELHEENGWIFEDNDGSLEIAAGQWWKALRLNWTTFSIP